MHAGLLRIALNFTRAAALVLFLSGCAVTPDHCKSKAEARADTRPRQIRLLQQFDRQRLGVPGKEFEVFTPKPSVRRGGGPPVIVLHEMPALSPDVLDLALRVSKEGYSVYVPLLWGNENENAHSRLLFLRRLVELRANSEWKAGAAEVDRPILDRLTSLCHSIISRHPEKRMGVIGNCLTGVFPFALAARVPQVVAPIASQPTLPLSFSRRAAARTGLSPAELKMLHWRIEGDPTFQLLGFRFEEDRASRRERFDTFEQEFGKRFLNGTLPLAHYHSHDGLDRHVHAVLTSCYSTNPRFATFQAWRECADFLKVKLSGDSPSSYRFQRRVKGAAGCAMVRHAYECSRD